MKQRITGILLVLCMLLALLPSVQLTASARSETDIAYPVEGGNIYFNASNGTIEDCDESVIAAVIPSEINGVAVTTIGISSFKNCTNLTSVTIPDSVTSINNSAFYACSSLATVSFGKSLNVLGDGVFYNCTSLTDVTIPEGVTTIGRSTFYGCTSLTSVTIPVSVTSILADAFNHCDNLTSVVIPIGVTSIGNFAFRDCEKLESVKIGNAVTSIGRSAFDGCTSLANLTIGSNVKAIGDWAFDGCTNLANVTIPASVTSIGHHAFYQCESLAGVYFLGDAPEVGSWAFQTFDSGDINIPGLTLYYLEGKSGWTTPEWNGYPTATWNSGIQTEPGVVTPEGYAFLRDSYSFANYGIKITKEYFTTLYEKGPGKVLYNKHKNAGDGGVCFGMSYTTAAIYNGFPEVSRIATVKDNIIDYQFCTCIRDIQNPNKYGDIAKTSAFSINDDLTLSVSAYIKYAHIYQWSSSVVSARYATYQDIQGLYNAVKDYTDGGNIAVTLLITHYDLDANNVNDSACPHAVLAVGYDGCDILIDDPNNTEEFERLSINEDLSWSYSGAWLGADIVNSENSTISYLEDYYMPYYYLSTATCAKTWHETSETINASTREQSNGQEETYLDGMERVDADSTLLMLDCGSVSPLSSNAVKLDESGSSQNGIYWLTGSSNVSLSKITGENNEITMAGDDKIISLSTDDVSNLSATVHNSGVELAFNGTVGQNCAISLSTINEDDEQVTLEIVAELSDRSVRIQETADGAKITGFSEGTVYLKKDDAEISSSSLDSESGSAIINYDKTGEDDSLSVFESSDEIIASGDGWTLSADYVLTILHGGETGYVGETTGWEDYSDSIRAVVIQEGVRAIYPFAFGWMPELRSVSLPESLEEIGMYAFSNCPELKQIYIPKNVSEIGMWAFGNCTALTAINVDPENEFFASDRFGVLYNESMSTLLCVPAGFQGDYTLPATVSAVGDSSAFYSCVGLTAIQVEDGNAAFSSVNGVLFDREMTRLIAFPAAVGGNYNVPDGVEVIADNAFGGAVHLTSIVFPESLRKIEYGAFEECTSLKAAAFKGNAPEADELIFQAFNSDAGWYEAIPGLTLYYINGKAGWTQPAWNGIPTATWDGINIPKSNTPAPSTSFVDVKGDEWFAEAVNYAVSNGLMNGMGGNKFEPNTGMTRAMLVTVLWRYAGSPIEGKNTFTDLTQDWYIPAVTWAAHNGIVGGVGGGKFDPDANITREQMAAILYRYSNFIGADTSARVDLSSFPDARKVSSYAEEALSWAVASGLITGTKEGSKTYLDPLGNATRAQVATILMRYIEGMSNAPEIQFLGVEDAYSDTKTYQGKLCCYHIPKAVFSGVGKLSINEKIYSELYGVLESELYSSDSILAGMNYNWGKKNDVVSIYADAHVSYTDWTRYYIYNLSAKNGAELSNEQVLSALNVTQADYKSLLSSAINGLFARYEESYSDQAEWYDNLWTNALKRATLEFSTPFVGENGHLCAIVAFEWVAGQGDYDWLFDLETGEQMRLTNCTQHG